MARKRKIHVTEEDIVFMHGEDKGSGCYFVSINTPYHQGFTSSISFPYNERDREIQLKDIEFLIDAFSAQKKWLLGVKSWKDIHEGEE